MTDAETLQTKISPTNVIYRKCDKCEEEEEKTLQRKESVSSTPFVSPAVNQTLQSPGQPLHPGDRCFMEKRFGFDFSNVRTYDDSIAHQSAKDINALAYTHRNNIIFGKGQYEPHTEVGKKLLAHELTHVVQQTRPNLNSHREINQLQFNSVIGNNLPVHHIQKVPTLQRRNGVRPPRRPPTPPLGQWGQLPGQKRPPTIRERREAFERQQRDRFERARREFEKEIRASQQRLERWAEHGSEPRTPRERAIRAILKFWEAWDDLTTNWDNIHKEFEDLVSKRKNLKELKPGSESIIAQIDQGIAKTYQALQQFDSEFFDSVTKWSEQVRLWRENVDWLNVQEAIEGVTQFIALFIEFWSLMFRLQEKLNKIQAYINYLDREMLLSKPFEMRPTIPTIRQAD